ncbi:PfkB family carbohydrate kinase [uncultured Methanobrevibacter sp.]|uniref:PfkB family carbohydrate kinase n=1 Tax=uncultured Methanobrevibacter sp. TaxID=253161 RepID=UPI0025E52289|nr:PfkB family carbohydrate kinase [uncultured Methanobrevibacter sp.]
MTLVVIGPVTKDLIVIGSEKSHRVGGATYFQSFVFEKFYGDYLACVNCDDGHLIEEFPDSTKVKVIKKDNTHFFINEYPFDDNLDIRNQLSNFADIPILPSDLEEILPEKIDGFVINSLNRYDFPSETMEYLKSFNVPIFLSVQGFLRIPCKQVNENYAIGLDTFDDLDSILSGVCAIFMDEAEAKVIGFDYDVDEIIITNGSFGSRVLADREIKIDAFECEEVVDTTGCGDTYMAAYVSHRLKNCSIEESGNFASRIASEKLKRSGHY